MFFDEIIFKEMTNNSLGKQTFNNNVELFNSQDGFMYGNMFKNEYKGYKDYKVAKLSATNEKGQMLLKIYEYDFALNDLSLYLDLHPEDKNVYELFKVYSEKERNLVSEYEKRYGPLELDNTTYENYDWYKGPWPFEGVNL